MNESRPAKASFLTGIGIDVSEAGTPFWKPDVRVRHVRILAARAPTIEERVKHLKRPDGTQGDELTILAIFDIEVEGVPHRWDVSSKRALVALDAAIHGLPCDLDVCTRGSGKGTTYSVQPHRDPPPRPKKQEGAASEELLQSFPCACADCKCPAIAKGKEKTAVCLHCANGNHTGTAVRPAPVEAVITAVPA